MNLQEKVNIGASDILKRHSEVNLIVSVFTAEGKLLMRRVHGTKNSQEPEGKKSSSETKRRHEIMDANRRCL